MFTIKLDFVSRISKRFCLLSFMLTLLLYLCYALHSCFIANVQHFHQIQQQDITKPFQGIKQLNENNFISIFEKETVVRVVPLIQNTEQNETLDGAPKYRFLRQQGLRPSRKFPDALIIGVKKGGTRALLEFVRLHPDVRAAGSEVHFFDRFYSKGFQWYRQHMPPTLEGQVTMEKTPSYFVTKEVPPRVHKMNSAMKLLVVVRDPVTRAISDYTQAVSKKMGMQQFEKLAFLNQSNDRGNKVDISWGPVKIGMYAQHLERWLHYFPLKQLLFVSGERLVVDPAAEMARVQETRKPQVFYTF